MAFPPVFTNAWDTTFPPDTQAANLLGQDLRNFRVDVMQRMSLLSGTFANRPTPENVNATWGGAGYGLVYFSVDTSQIFQWTGAAWSDITASFSASRGVVGASVNLVGQTVAIGSTLLYAVPVGLSGLYRATADILITAAGTGGTIRPVFLWNTGVTGQSFNGLSVDCTGFGESGAGNTPLPSSTTFYALAGTNINYQIVFNAVTGPPTYSFRARLEFMG